MCGYVNDHVVAWSEVHQEVEQQVEEEVEEEVENWDVKGVKKEVER